MTILITLAVAGAFPKPAYAVAANAYDVINQVNAMRVARGLAPLQINAALMASAQAHSEYQASTGTVTHTGAGGTTPKARALAAGYPGGSAAVITENIAAGPNLSASYIANSMWADDLHMIPMVNAYYRDVGAGAAVGKNNFVYYTLQAGYVHGQLPLQTAAATDAGTVPQVTPAPLTPVQTSTPRPDGSIYHVVQPGQFLWNIAVAYGLNVPTLIALNNYPPTPFLYAGEKILIRPAFTTTPTPRESPTLPPTVTRTVTTTRTPTVTATPAPTATPTITITPTKEPLLPFLPKVDFSNRRVMAIGIIVICAIGLLLVLFSTLRPKKRG
ncbi:MAG TPA: CAP domain-containing protein [Anaerolineaceae bacterium]